MSFLFDITKIIFLFIILFLVVASVFLIRFKSARKIQKRLLRWILKNMKKIATSGARK